MQCSAFLDVEGVGAWQSDQGIRRVHGGAFLAVQNTKAYAEYMKALQKWEDPRGENIDEAQ